MLFGAVVGVKCVNDFVKLLKGKTSLQTFINKVLKVWVFFYWTPLQFNVVQFIRDGLQAKSAHSFGVETVLSVKWLMDGWWRRKPFLWADSLEISIFLLVKRLGDLEIVKGDGEEEDRIGFSRTTPKKIWWILVQHDLIWKLLILA